MSVKPLKLITKTSERREGVVATLKNMLKLAEEGELLGVAVAAVGIDGSTHTAHEPGDNPATLIGAIERVKHRLLSNV